MENYFKTRPLEVAGLFLSIVAPPVLFGFALAQCLGFTPGRQCGGSLLPAGQPEPYEERAHHDF